MRCRSSRRFAVLLAGFMMSVPMLGASATAAFAVTQALPVAVTGSTSWALAPSLPPAGPATTFDYGNRPLVPIIGDWDGNGSRTPGSFESGRFKLSNTLPAGAPTIDVAFGDPRGFPVVGDFNGDGRDDVAVHRNGLWQLRTETGGIGSGGTVATPVPFTFGTGSWPATVPVAGDWDANGVDGIGTFTYATGLWQLRQTPQALGLDLPSFTYTVGASAYPVVGDWNADGTDSVGVRSATPASTWHLKNINAAGIADITPFAFGLANDLPLVGGVRVDAPPVAVNDTAPVAEDANATVVAVLANDTDVDGGPKLVFSVVQPANGAVVITGGGTGLTYKPSANYCNNPPGGRRTPSRTGSTARPGRPQPSR